MTRPRLRRALTFAVGLLLAACTATDAAGPAPATTLRLYTSVTQDTVDAVLGAFAVRHPDIAVELLRAPTGELDARMAAELRTGGITADVLWGTDPLSVQAYAQRGLLAAWTPAGAEEIPAQYRTATFWGTRILNMVIVHRRDAQPAPTDWADLLEPAYAGAVAIPDPGFAGSAFAALGYFAASDAYGLDYYRRLHDNGATQLQAIPEVLTAVAEGRFAAGMTLDKTVRDAIALGSPVEIAWPKSGAIAIYSPITVFAAAHNRAAAETFVEFTLSQAGQAAIAGTGWQPIRADVEDGPPIDGAQVAPDWSDLFDRQEELLEQYREIFGG
jgi:iron(III) transport system substrate-binding protein